MTTDTSPSPIHFPLASGDMLDLFWSGQPRTVIVDTEDGALILRDLTDAEAEQLDVPVFAADGSLS